MKMNRVSIIFLVIFAGCSEKQLYESSGIVTATQVTSQMAGVPQDYKPFVGVYKMQGASFDEVAITQENGKLFAQATGEQKVEIYPEKENTFNVPAFNAKITFTNQSDEGFSGITVLLDGTMLEGKR
jgi:hypothetical protein